MIKNKSGEKKEYIYKKDISDFLLCGTSKVARIFQEVKEYELSLMEIEMFENRIPQDLFHEWRTKRRKRGN
ncbi:hypothetical protein MGH68_12190 [Erysipelothrix sp. D19-032]